MKLCKLDDKCKKKAHGIHLGGTQLLQMSGDFSCI